MPQSELIDELTEAEFHLKAAIDKVASAGEDESYIRHVIRQVQTELDSVKTAVDEKFQGDED